MLYLHFFHFNLKLGLISLRPIAGVSGFLQVVSVLHLSHGREKRFVVKFLADQKRGRATSRISDELFLLKPRSLAHFSIFPLTESLKQTSLCIAQSYHKSRIIKGLMTQRRHPSLTTTSIFPWRNCTYRKSPKYTKTTCSGQSFT